MHIYVFSVAQKKKKKTLLPVATYLAKYSLRKRVREREKFSGELLLMSSVNYCFALLLLYYLYIFICVYFIIICALQ